MFAGKPRYAQNFAMTSVRSELSLHQVLVRVTQTHGRRCSGSSRSPRAREDGLSGRIQPAVPRIAVLIRRLVEVDLWGRWKDREGGARLEVIGHELLASDVLSSGEAFAVCTGVGAPVGSRVGDGVGTSVGVGVGSIVELGSDSRLERRP